MNSTPRLSLPFLSAGQAQKEFTHNEALQTLDVVCAAAVEQEPTRIPPQAPTIGSCYLVGDGATGAWTSRDGCVAAFTSGGWRFVQAVEGMGVYVKSLGVPANYRLGTWEIGQTRALAMIINGQQVVGNRALAINSAAGGTVIDSEARIAIDQILTALRHHGLIES